MNIQIVKPQPGPQAAFSSSAPDKVNEMWGTDMTQTITIREDRANVFVAVEHSNSVRHDRA